MKAIEKAGRRVARVTIDRSGKIVLDLEGPSEEGRQEQPAEDDITETGRAGVRPACQGAVLGRRRKTEQAGVLMPDLMTPSDAAAFVSIVAVLCSLWSYWKEKRHGS